MEQALKKTDRQLFVRVLLYTFVFGIAAHGYCMFNGNFTHDALIGFHFDPADPLYASNGRYLRPFYFWFRGNWALPLVNCGLFLLYTAIACWLIIRLLKIQSPLLCAVICGILTTNGSVALLNASYLHDADTYGLAFLLAVCGTWLTAVFPKKGRWLAVPVWCCSLGLYQAYIQAAILLLLLLHAIRLIQEPEQPIRNVLRHLFLDLAAIAVSFIIYYAGYQIAMAATEASRTDFYNSPSNVGKLNAYTILRNIWYAFWAEFRWFFNPPAQKPGICALANCLLGVITVLSARVVFRQNNLDRKRILVVVLLLAAIFPGMVSILLLSGIDHELTVYSFYLCILIPIWFLEQIREEAGFPSFLRFRFVAAAVLSGILIADGCLYANTLYLVKEMDFQATLSVCTRILDRVEQVPDYVPGQTPVAVIGGLTYGPLSKSRPDTDKSHVGLWNNYAFLYYQAYRVFFQTYLGYPINLVPEEENIAWQERPEIQDMTPFPDAGCCRMVDGTLVVRMSY